MLNRSSLFPSSRRDHATIKTKIATVCGNAIIQKIQILDDTSIVLRERPGEKEGSLHEFELQDVEVGEEAI